MDDELLERLNRAVLVGNGKEPLMTRMAITENEVEGMKETLEQMSRNLNKVLLLVLGVFLTVIGELIVRGVGH